MGLFNGSDNSLKELCQDNVKEENIDESLFDGGLIPESLKNSALDLYDKTGFKDVLDSGYSSILGTLKEIGSYNTNLGGLVSRPRGNDPIEPGITGLYHYGTPNATQYKECTDVEGLSVWDTKGWWRCLFPQQVIESRLGKSKEGHKVIEEILTKEKVEKDKSNKYGVFFPDWSLYMKWRVYMNQLIEERREKEISSKKNDDLKDWAYDFYQDRDKTPEDIMMNKSLVGLEKSSSSPQVIGKSEYVTMQSTPDGKEEIKQLKTYYNNGTTSIESIKKVYPKDGGKPRVERTVRTVPSSSEGRGGF
ncbi:Mitochondrial peculiar membrane protein 1 [Nakaseomyces bracarensis]|uniref:Mitochondrial peculiar membrane protein 1 n=1 Tax=Nakaseomyces bracarensis TaxID=273131 RepID=A0ABR4NVL7_9SACH